MMAPYAIAHMKIGLKLAETGYRFASNERVRIYLTNALEPWQRQLKLPDFEALAHEAVAVNEVKREKRFTVVVGNPPYSNFGQLNKNPFILGLLDDYKRGLDEKKLNLDDDFIKFVRFSQYVLNTADTGILGMITNNVFLDGITHRRMRESLAESFSKLRLLDLHGSAKKQEKAPGGAKEENVFDIQQGVGLTLAARPPMRGQSNVEHAELWGSRSEKYRTLERTSVGSTSLRELAPKSPHWFFVPVSFAMQEEVQTLLSVAEVFNVSQGGISTDRDELFFDFDKDELKSRLKKFFSKTYDAEFKSTYRIIPSSSYDIESVRDQARFSEDHIRPCVYRPFDTRWLYYDCDVTSRPARKVMEHMIAGPNLALACLRQSRKGEDGAFFVGSGLINKNPVSLFDIATVFPLWLYEQTLSFDLENKSSGATQSLSRRPNFTVSFLKKLAAKLHLPQNGEYSLSVGLTPEDIFHYIYAVFHSPGYRDRYAEFLKIDFPRLPLTGNLNLFRALSHLGGELVALHLLESPKLDQPITEFIGDKNPEVEKPSWSDNTVWVDKAQSVGFKGVREDVWNFHIGGYQVCQKWLKDRKGRTLSQDDLAHYQKIVIALSETIRLMAEIDRVIETHGGWPDAFTSAAGQDANAAADKSSRE